MKVGDVVDVITGCLDCGTIPATVLDLVHDKALVEVIGELPHKAKERVLWIDTRKLRVRDE